MNDSTTREREDPTPASTDAGKRVGLWSRLFRRKSPGNSADGIAVRNERGALSAYLLIPPSFVPDLVEWYEYERGERHESVFFGLWMSIHQIGLGVAGFVLGLLLQAFGYDGAAATQSASGILGVRLAFGALPAVFLVVASLVLLRYRITRERFEAARDAVAAGGRP